MAERICNVTGCGGKLYCKGFCQKHYERLHRTGSLLPALRPPKKRCSVDGCEGEHWGKGFCKTCYSRMYVRLPEFRARHKERVWRKNGINLTADQYDKMLSDQGGVCAICGEPERVKRAGKVMQLAVDHDHETGEVRGLLCDYCNRLLLTKRNVGLLRRAIDYPTKPNPVLVVSEPRPWERSYRFVRMR